jgi:hypothetical protein
MMRATSIGLLTLFCIATLGCAAAQEQQRAMANAPTANVAGSWSGSVGSGGPSAPVSATLSQSGTNVTGNVAIGGRPDFSGPVTGTVQGQLLTLSVATATFSQLQVKGDTITGQSSLGPITLRRTR